MTTHASNDRLADGAFALGFVVDTQAPTLDDEELREIMRAWYPVVHIARDRGDRFALIVGAPGKRIADFAATWADEGALLDAMVLAQHKVGRGIFWRTRLCAEDEAALRRIFGNAGVLH